VAPPLIPLGSSEPSLDPLAGFRGSYIYKGREGNGGEEKETNAPAPVEIPEYANDYTLL